MTFEFIHEQRNNITRECKTHITMYLIRQKKNRIRSKNINIQVKNRKENRLMAFNDLKGARICDSCEFLILWFTVLCTCVDVYVPSSLTADRISHSV